MPCAECAGAGAGGSGQMKPPEPMQPEDLFSLGEKNPTICFCEASFCSSQTLSNHNNRSAWLFLFNALTGLRGFLHLSCALDKEEEEEPTQPSQLFHLPSFSACSCLGSSGGRRSHGQGSWLWCTRCWWRWGSPQRQRIARSVQMPEAWNGPPKLESLAW